MQVNDILKERQSTHGEFSNVAKVAQNLKDVFYENVKGGLSNIQAEAIEMIFHKIARIASGDASFKDHWDDIAGYAILASKENLDDVIERIAYGKDENERRDAIKAFFNGIRDESTQNPKCS